MRVIVPPVVVGERICRIVAPVESLLEVEEWAGQWWEPSTVTLSEASLGEIASDALLAARGVPMEDWCASEPRSGDHDIQALLQTADPERMNAMYLDESVTRSNPPRPRSYPGNSRFSSRTIAAAERVPDPPAQDRRRRSDSNWKGPRRRKTDKPTDGDGWR